MSRTLSELTSIVRQISIDPTLSTSWYNAIVDGEVIGACKTALVSLDSEALEEFADALVENTVIEELQVLFDRLVERQGGHEPDRIDSKRFHFALSGCVLVATLAAALLRRIPEKPRAVDLVFSMADTLRLSDIEVRISNAGSPGLTYSRALLWYWVNEWLAGQPGPQRNSSDEWLGVQLAAETYSIPIASVESRRKGSICHLLMRSFGSPAFRPQLVPSIETTAFLVGTGMLSALAESAPAELRSSVAWSLKPPADYPEAVFIGRSVRGAADFALTFLNSERVIPPGILVLADVSDNAQLLRVSHEKTKLKAAVNYDLALSNANQSMQLIDLVILPEEARDAELLESARFIKVRFCSDTAALKTTVLEHVDAVEGKVHRVSKRYTLYTAMAPYDKGWTIDSRIIGPKKYTDGRVDIRTTIECSVNSTAEFELHHSVMDLRAALEATPYSMPKLSLEELGWKHKDVEREYLDTKRNIKMHFTPRVGFTYGLDVATYGGYEETDHEGYKNRNGHTHLKANIYYDELVEELDLRAFLPGRHPRYALSADPASAPSCRLWRWEKGAVAQDQSCEACKKAKDRPLVEATRIEPGLWRWVIRDVKHGGALWLEWDAAVRMIPGQHDEGNESR